MPLNFNTISADKLSNLSGCRTVFFFPVGPLEDHGSHLPMGLDLEEATRLCFLAAERLEKEMPGWTGILMPQAPLGINSNTTKLAITVRAHVLRDWLLDACKCLIKSGFFHFVCFSGDLGPRQLTAIEEAGKILSWQNLWFPSRWFAKQRPYLISARSPMVSAKTVRESPFWPDPIEHGGKRDTSIALAVCPQQVDPSYAYLPFRSSSPCFFGRSMSRFRKQVSGYLGDPHHSTASEGDRLLSETINDIFPKLRAVWEGARPIMFRSWYSILPPNKSFFKLWLLAAVLLLTLWIWVYVNIQSMLIPMH